MAEPRYLQYDQIDKLKWDACMDAADNGLIYGYSSYLDAMATQWDGMVLNDYEAVMPLTWNRKYGFHYLFQPPFTACLGVFGKNVNAVILQQFLDHIPDKFKYWDISLNHGNLFTIPGYDLYERMNYVLPLKEDHHLIKDRYRDNLKRNIRRSEQYGNIASAGIELSQAVSLAKEQLQHLPGIKPADFSRFESLCRNYLEKGKCKLYGVKNSRGELMSSAVFLFSNNRAYYILPGNHPDGKTSGSSHALIDAFIKDHAGEELLLDFEGSDISSLAYFYSSFGAVEEKYAALKVNRLPGIVKWLKS